MLQRETDKLVYDLATTTPPAVTPASVAELKTQLRLDTTAMDADLLPRLLEAATEHLEGLTARSLISRTLTLKLQRFSQAAFGGTDSLQLPRGPVASITSVAYTDANGDAQTVSSDDYTLDNMQAFDLLTPHAGFSWPTSLHADTLLPVTITYVAGHGAATTDVPQAARQAVLFLAAHWFEHTEAALEQSVRPVPYGVRALAGSLRRAAWP